METCKINICNNPARAKGYCFPHYNRLKYTGSLLDRKGNIGLNKRTLKIQICTVDSCNQKHYAKGYCAFHYSRLKIDKNMDSIKHSREQTSSKYSRIYGMTISKMSKLFDLSIPTIANRLKNGLDLNIKSFRKGKYSHWWRGGVSEYPNHHIMKKNRKIILNNNLFCQNCKSARATQIHHIDESKDNHSLNNLMAVCQSCNLKLSTKTWDNKYTKIYGKNLSQFSREYNLSVYTVKKRLENNIPLSFPKYIRTKNILEKKYIYKQMEILAEVE